MKESLRIVKEEHQEIYRIRKTIADRTTRIEAISVDRTNLQSMDKWLWNISSEMINRERNLSKTRQATSAQDRLEVWRLIEGSAKPSILRKISNFIFG